MKKSKNDDLNGKTKNKKHSNNISVEKSNKDLADKKEDDLKIISKKSDVDNKKESEKETNKEEQLSNEITILKEEKLRLLAEMENLRKRFEREKIDLIKFSSINLIREILSPGDNLERALAAIPKDEKLPQPIKNLVEGLKMVQKEFSTILEKNGVKKIDSINKKFDHNYHQAMMEIEKEDVGEGTVVQEIQPGYIMHDRLLRPAMVGVSKKPSTKKLNNIKEKTDNKEKIKSEENQEK
jgi:molecular chaperone GrpE